jgi:ornithine carbamoyltransferase
MSQHFLSLADISAERWPALLDRAAELKRNRLQHTLAGKSVALVFEKASTRTRVSFDVGVFELGGHPLALTPQASQLGRGEPIEDTARVLSGYCHAIVFRTFGQDRVDKLARAATVPVINALTDEHHPCQVATDVFTVREKLGTMNVRYAWVGDANNMANSWIEAAALFGLDLVLACPAGFQPDPMMIADAQAKQRELGRGSLWVTDDPKIAVRNANVISTDVWASMGQEQQDTEKRKQAFAGYTLDTALLDHAAPDAVVLHCLPAHRGEEITAEVLDGPRSLAWIQAENRLHVGKAILEAVV